MLKTENNNFKDYANPDMLYVRLIIHRVLWKER